MITRIKLDNVASFKNATILETNKKVNLIYGLNGTGKSTLTNFLYNPNEQRFSDCLIENTDLVDILVYNQQFIKDYFYEPDSLKGIFTLSKENKDAIIKIQNAEHNITLLESEKNEKEKIFNKLNKELNDFRLYVEDQIWEIKKKYTGGDRVLEYCLEGLKKEKEKLFIHFISIDKPKEEPLTKIDELKKEVELLKGVQAQKYDLMKIIMLPKNLTENYSVLGKVIIGNDNSTLSSLINKWGNSDWVKKGLTYLPNELDINENATQCPFCQENTITKVFVESVKEYFNEAYQQDMYLLSELLSNYKASTESLLIEAYESANPFFREKEKELKEHFNILIETLHKNIEVIENKIKNPSQEYRLINPLDKINNINNLISEINEKTVSHNKRIDNKEDSLKKIKTSFWNLMRWDYDSTYKIYEKKRDDYQKEITVLENDISIIKNKIKSLGEEIRKYQQNTVNIEEAINKINSGLVDLGINDFRIINHSDYKYRICRDGNSENTFSTLSEGEKMIISFLYFQELCKGKRNPNEIPKKKVVVIDDPISSLSHIYIFNIGQFIKNDFMRSTEYVQLFILTHSLYFFYELTEIKHESRNKNQKLFRLIKNNDGSKIVEMQYEEIQNDYHSYWSIIKDESQPPALIANCMRNIIEYFFNFIDKKDANCVFQNSIFQANKYQAFYRYINRESHSLGQNIFDLKEFNYCDFRDAFKQVFVESGYDEHYYRMMK